MKVDSYITNLENNKFQSEIAAKSTYQAARVRMGPPRKHSGAITAPIMPVCTIQATCLGPNPGL